MFIYFWTLDTTFSLYIGCSDLQHEMFFTARKKTRLWSTGIYCPAMIKMFSVTSTLMLVRGLFVTCAFALHTPVRS